MKKRISIVLIIVMMLSLCACGSKSSSYAASAPMAAPSESYAADAMYSGGFASEEAWLETESPAENSGTAENDAPAINPEKIIYSADTTIETTDFDAAVSGLNELLKRYGGFIESASINDANYYNKSRGSIYHRNAYYTLRIPSENFNSLMGELSTLGNVPYSHVYTDNITSQYYDVQARLESYKVQEATLLKLMDKAESIEDIITVESRLSEVRYMIESLQSTINNWDRQVSYSSISLTVDEVSEYTPEAKETYGQRLGRAVKDGFENVVEFFQDLLVFLAETLPTLIPVGVIVFFVVKGIKKLFRIRKDKKAKKAAAKAAKAEEKTEN